MRSKIRWFTKFCNSHYLSHFAAFFIDARTKRSVVESFDLLYKLLREANDDEEFYALTDHDAPRGRLVAIKMAETERQFQQYMGGFRALLERQLAELRALDGGSQKA